MVPLWLPVSMRMLRQRHDLQAPDTLASRPMVSGAEPRHAMLQRRLTRQFCTQTR